MGIASAGFAVAKRTDPVLRGTTPAALALCETSRRAVARNSRTSLGGGGHTRFGLGAAAVRWRRTRRTTGCGGTRHVANRSRSGLGHVPGTRASHHVVCSPAGHHRHGPASGPPRNTYSAKRVY